MPNLLHGLSAGQGVTPLTMAQQKQTSQGKDFATKPESAPVSACQDDRSVAVLNDEDVLRAMLKDEHRSVERPLRTMLTPGALYGLSSAEHTIQKLALTTF
jgi:hypothetical protein